MQYLLIKQRGVLRLALPAKNARKQLLGLRYFQVFTVQARLWRIVLGLLIRCRLARYVFPEVSVEQLPLPLNSLEFCKSVLQNDREFIFQFPKMPHRQKYSILSETPWGLRYLKIALDEKSKKELRGEYRISTFLKHFPLEGFHSPRLIRHFELQDMVVNEFEALPPGCHSRTDWLATHEQIWRELSYIQHQEQPAEQTEWFRAIDTADRQHRCHLLKGKVLHFSFIHGDFVPWNILFKNGRVFLIDFEEAATCGPYLFDPLHYLLVAGNIGSGNPLEEFRNIRKRLQKLHNGEHFEYHLLAALLHERFRVQVLEPWLVDRLIEQTMDRILSRVPQPFAAS